MRIEIESYRRPVVQYNNPKARRQFMAKARTLIKLAKRVHDGKLFLPDLLRAIQEAAEELCELGGLLLLTDKGSAYLDDLAWIRSPQFLKSLPEGWEGTVTERIRQHQDERCTICRVRLVYPAQVVWRRGLDVVATSAPLGIGCLNGRYGKLNDLITKVRVVKEELVNG